MQNARRAALLNHFRLFYLTWRLYCGPCVISDTANLVEPHSKVFPEITYQPSAHIILATLSVFPCKTSYYYLGKTCSYQLLHSAYFRTGYSRVRYIVIHLKDVVQTLSTLITPILEIIRKAHKLNVDYINKYNDNSRFFSGRVSRVEVILI